MQRKFLTYVILFFLPVMLVYGVLEYLSLQIPSAFQFKQDYIAQNQNEIEVLVLGSSQAMNAINPEYISTPTLSLASGDQHHDTDLKLLQGIEERLPNLKTVIVEVSYSHFELPHNGKDFWKNSLYLKYYDINCFERNTYFKDSWLFHSNPTLFSHRIEEYYWTNKNWNTFNEYGFNARDTYGQFARLNYDAQKIDSMSRFKINTEPNLALYANNTEVFQQLIDFATSKGLNVIIVAAPMYKTYLKKRNPEILKRRNDYIKTVTKKHRNINFFNKETDTIHYNPKDFYNQSHLSEEGARKFSKELNQFLKELY